VHWYCACGVDEPSTSGLQENDYPVLSDDRVGLAALKEIGAIKRLPLPAELAERFACILHWQLTFCCCSNISSSFSILAVAQCLQLPCT